MQALRQAFSGILLALVSAFLVLGSASLSLSENGLAANPQPLFPALVSPTTTAQNNPLIFPPTLPEINFTPIIDIITATVTITPPGSCPPPAGWIQITVLPGDTLPGLAYRYATSLEALRQANCLVSDTLIINTILYVPPSPTATFIPCGAPYGWVLHIVQPGENLFRISLNYRLPVAELQKANCLGNSTTIYVGQKLRVPNVATSTPAIPNTPTNLPTITLTNTQPVPPTETILPPTVTSTPIPPSATPTLKSPTPSPTLEEIPSPSPTNTPTP